MGNPIHKIADYYGKEKQAIQCVEELNELSCAILHYLKCHNSKEFDNLIEEIADVEIMLAQIKYLCGIGDVFINNIKLDKVCRQLKRIESQSKTDG